MMSSIITKLNIGKGVNLQVKSDLNLSF